MLSAHHQNSNQIDSLRMKQDFDDCSKILMALLGSPELVARWWNIPNKAFDLELPYDVWVKDSNKVKEYIYSFNRM